jgi:predicted dehydrogenase
MPWRKKNRPQSLSMYTDYRKLLEKPATSMRCHHRCTPDHWHALVTVARLPQAGKDVYCEKPLTLTHPRRARIMTQVARGPPERIVQTGSQQRSDDKFRLGCELVRNGRLGKIKSVRVGLTYVNFDPHTVVADTDPPARTRLRTAGSDPPPGAPYNKNRVHYNFRFFWDYSGGQMTNWGAHHLDIAQWGLGMPTTPDQLEIQATAKFDPAKRFEVPVESDITYRYADGVTLLLHPGSRPQDRHHLPGRERLGPRQPRQPRGQRRRHPRANPCPPMPSGSTSSKDHMDNWFECIKSRKLPICDVEIGHRSASVCHLGSLAMRLGRKLLNGTR